MSTEELTRPTRLRPRPSLPTPRPLRPNDRDALARLIRRDSLFTKEEASVALELIDAALAEPGGEYRILVGELDGSVEGYVCYGPTPMTEGTWDLYWVATSAEARGRGVARALVEKMEEELRGFGARLVRVETSNLDGYASAHAFYVRLAYPVVARLTDFYKPGEDLLVMMKQL